MRKLKIDWKEGVALYSKFFKKWFLDKGNYYVDLSSKKIIDSIYFPNYDLTKPTKIIYKIKNSKIIWRKK